MAPMDRPRLSPRLPLPELTPQAPWQGQRLGQLHGGLRQGVEHPAVVLLVAGDPAPHGGHEDLGGRGDPFRWDETMGHFYGVPVVFYDFPVGISITGLMVLCGKK